MYQVFLSVAGVEKDYTSYVVSQSISITKNINAPSTCSMMMCNTDDSFVLPPARAYLRIYSTKYEKNLYTGYLQNDPSTTFMGTGNHQPGTHNQIFQFAMNFTSDEYLLNIKSIPFFPAFVNQSQGSILRTLANVLCPGMFDFTYCASGDLVPYLAYDPSQNWSQIAKSFADSSRYRYSVVNKEVHFQPYGDGALGITYDETLGQGTFDPSKLTTTAMTTKLVNDVTIVGQQEAGNNHEDFFIGDGFTGVFPLKHKVFGLADAEAGSGILLQESWSSTSLNTQTWQAQDPSNNFYYGAQNSSSLNILTGLVNDPGTSFIAAQSALELAGGVSMQHGEVVFNDVCSGIIGGIYDTEVVNGYGDISLDPNSMEAGYLIQPTASVVVTASGASGISIQPTRLNLTPSGAFNVVTQVNKSYVMFTNITAPAATRYNLIYRTIAGVAYGEVDQTDVLGTITWAITETDLFTGVQNFYTFSMANQSLPVTVLYALVDNQQMNVTITTTQITSPIPGSLNVKCKIGAGLLAPIYISGNVQYTGAFVTPTGGNLPIQPNDFGPENNFALGTGLGTQAAELDSGQVSDTLNFYSDDLPGVGVRIRLQSWESQAAIARLQDAQSIAKEAIVVGDDGIRSSVVTNLSPLPRTSEDCEHAAQAYLADSVGTRYQGTYNASHIFFAQFSDDIDFFPTCGRYLYVNSPARRLYKERFLVSAVTIAIAELAGEITNYAISFGADMQIEKLLATFLPVTSNVLTPLDTALSPTPQQLENIGTNYLPDVQQSTILGMVSGAQIALTLSDVLPLNCSFEVRNADLNWGLNDNRLLGRYAVTGTVLIPRNSYDETWYIRMTSKTISGNIVVSSRRSKVIRVMYPRIPTPPLLTYLDSSRLQYDFTGDVRNVEGIQLYDGLGVSGFYVGIVGSEQDMNFDLNQLRGQGLQAIVGDGPSGTLGQYDLAQIPASLRSFEARFFNLMWEFSSFTKCYIPPPLAPKLGLGFRFGQSVQIRVSGQDSPPRQDIDFTRLQVANSPTFTTSAIIAAIDTAGNPGIFTATLPATGDLWARAFLSDYISSGAWSQPLHVPLSALIASDYLTAQGSVPPSITQANTTGGGLFTYLAYSDVIVMYCAPFGVLWPNGAITNIFETSGTFTTALDATGILQGGTTYGFFPAVFGPSTQSPSIYFNGPYLNYTSETGALAGQFRDGSVPLTNGYFGVQTSTTASGQNGGGGGGTGGGGNCGILSSLIELADGRLRTLRDIKIGEIVRTRSTNNARIVMKQITQELTYLLKTSSGKQTRCALAHTLYDGKWKALSDIIEDLSDGKEVHIATEDGLDCILSISDPSCQEICKISLVGLNPKSTSDDDHVYMLDDIWTHNTNVKNGIY